MFKYEKLTKMRSNKKNIPITDKVKEIKQIINVLRNYLQIYTNDKFTYRPSTIKFTCKGTNTK